MRYEIRELGLGEILDQAVTLTKNHFGLFITILLVLQIPFGLVTNLWIASLLPEAPTLNANNPAELIQQFINYLNEVNEKIAPVSVPANFINLLIVLPLTNAALIHAIAAQYLKKPATVGSSFGRAFKIILPVIGTWILVYLAVMVGTFLCIIPGIIFAFWFALATQVVVIEGAAGTSAMKRSKALMKGNIGTFFVLGLLVFAVSVGLNLILWFVPQPHVRMGLTVLIQGVVTIFASAAMVVFYFSCRCKHENFDLTLLAQAVGEEPPPEDTPSAFQG